MGHEAKKTADFLIIGGSFFHPRTMEPLARQFWAAGQRAEVIYDLPTQDGAATAEDHARVIANKLKRLEHVVLVSYSAGSIATEMAMEMVEKENGSHPVEISVSISGSFGPLPPSAGLGDLGPRNTEKFRQGLIELPNGLTAFRKDMALDVFFNDSPDIGDITIPGMMPVRRVDAPMLPEQLHADILLYLLPENDYVRRLRPLLGMASHYENMRLRIIEGDHAVPMTRPDYVGRIILDQCVRFGAISPPDEPAVAFPSPRRAADDTQPAPQWSGYDGPVSSITRQNLATGATL